MNRARCVMAATMLLVLALPGFANAAGQSTCVVGETRSPNTSTLTFGEPEWSAFQVVRPADCIACTGGAILLENATWRLRLRTLCTVTFEVTVVAAAGGGCPFPDTSQVLCGPVLYQHTPAGTTTAEDVVFPVAPDCCITGPAFVRLKVVDTGGCPPDQVVSFHYTNDPCTTCGSYTLAPGGLIQDSCDFYGSTGAVHTISVGASCCGATGVHRRAWGTVKVLYR